MLRGPVKVLFGAARCGVGGLGERQVRAGSEFISRDLDRWAFANDVTLDVTGPGKPTDSGFIEAHNSKLSSDCLNAHCFISLADAREKLEDWRRHYNEDQPYSAIGYNVPIAVHYTGGTTSPSSWDSREDTGSGDPRLGSITAPAEAIKAKDRK